VPAAQDVDQGAQSTCAAPFNNAVPVALQNPNLHTHDEMPAPPGEPFEFGGHAVQELWPALPVVVE
jgi:hypothetical protein